MFQWVLSSKLTLPTPWIALHGNPSSLLERRGEVVIPTPSEAGGGTAHGAVVFGAVEGHY